MAMASVGKRKAERRDCQVKAQILRAGAEPVEALIMDFSATGARIRLLEDVDLPARFKLFIPSRPETKSVILRWKKKLEFGCEYSTGLADEETLYDVMARVERLEAATKGRAADAGGAAPGDLQRRLAEIEAKLTLGVGAPDLSSLQRRIDAVQKFAEDSVRRADESIQARIDELEGRMDGVGAPNAAERLARLEAMVETSPTPNAAAEGRGPGPAPDAVLIARIADIEARLMEPRRLPAGAADAATLDAKLRTLAQQAEDHAARVERFLSARIDDLERELISAPSAPSGRSSALDALDLKVADLARRLAEQSSARPADDLETRISDLEVTYMELRVDLAPLHAGLEDIRARLAETEERNEEIIGTLRNLLALLTAREGRRAAG